jgi:hypothetical protein
LQCQTLDDAIAFDLGKAGMEGGSGNVLLRQTSDLFLHQCNQGRNDESQSRHQQSRQLVTERFPLTGRHHGQGIATS